MNLFDPLLISRLEKMSDLLKLVENNQPNFINLEFLFRDYKVRKGKKKKTKSHRTE